MWLGKREVSVNLLHITVGWAMALGLFERGTFLCFPLSKRSTLYYSEKNLTLPHRHIFTLPWAPVYVFVTSHESLHLFFSLTMFNSIYSQPISFKLLYEPLYPLIQLCYDFWILSI